MVESLLAELARRGIVLVSDGDRLRFHPKAAMTPKLLDRLKEHKPEILEIMADPWPAAETEPAPCGKCNGWALWQNPPGRWRCMKCDPPTRAERWLEKAERLRNRYDN